MSGEGAPLASAVDKHRAPPGGPPLPLDLRDRLRMVDERRRLQRRPEQHHLTAARDDPQRTACRRRMRRRRDAAGRRPRLPSEGGDARLGVTRVHRAGPGAERLGQASVVAPRESRRGRRPGCRRARPPAPGTRAPRGHTRRGVLPAQVRDDRPPVRPRERRAHDGFRSADDGAELRHGGTRRARRRPGALRALGGHL